MKNARNKNCLLIGLLSLSLTSLIGCEDLRPARPSPGGSSGAGAGSGAASNAANVGTAAKLLSKVANPSDFADALAQIGVNFELDKISGGQGAPSHFGSGMHGSASNSTEFLDKENARLSEISEILADPEILELMVLCNVAKVFVENPYRDDYSQNNDQPYASVQQRVKMAHESDEVLGYSADTMLVINTHIDKDTMIEALRSFTKEEPVLKGLSVNDPSEYY